MSRRRTHPLPLPPRGGGYATEVREDVPAVGPQAELCRRTMCCICWALEQMTKGRDRRWHPMPPPGGYDWTKLPVLYERKGLAVLAKPTRAHHEPFLSQGGDDRRTMPMCDDHHNLGRFGARARHAFGSADEYFGYYAINPADVTAEMERRVARGG